jgi:propanol-preferring alcohol dehydrogenase
MSPLVAGLAPRGHLVVVGAAMDPISVATPDLIFGTRTIRGSLTGSSIENEDNLLFSTHHGVRPMNEIMPLSEAPKAYEHMVSGDARFRVVLDMTA